MTSVQTPTFKAAATGKVSKKSQTSAQIFVVTRLSAAAQRRDFIGNDGRTASGSNAPSRWSGDLNDALVANPGATARNVATDPNTYTHYFGAPYSGNAALMAGLRIIAKPSEFANFFPSLYTHYANWITNSIQQSGINPATLPNTLYSNLSALGYPLGKVPDAQSDPNGYQMFVAMMWMLYTSFNPFNVDTEGNTRVAFEAGQANGSLNLTQTYDQFAEVESQARSQLNKNREAKSAKTGTTMDANRAAALIDGYAFLTKNTRNIQTRQAAPGKEAAGKHRGGRNAESFKAEYDRLVADPTSKKYMLVATVNKGENVTFSSSGTTAGKPTYSGRSTISLPTGRSVVAEYSFLDVKGAERLIVRTTNPNWLSGLTLAARLILNEPNLTEQQVTANTKPITSMEGSKTTGLFNPGQV